MKNICHESPAFLKLGMKIDCALQLMVLFGTCAYFKVFRQSTLREGTFQLKKLTSKKPLLKKLTLNKNLLKV